MIPPALIARTTAMNSIDSLARGEREEEEEEAEEAEEEAEEEAGPRGDVFLPTDEEEEGGALRSE